MKEQKISISYWLWFKLTFGLKKRGKSVRESGGFLLGKQGQPEAVKVVFYDQFDESVSDSGIIQFKGAVELYEYLAKTGLRVLADIHTHPTFNTQQSESDRTHPMIKIKGHIAIIAPNFAKKPFLRPEDCSVYEYLGNFQWKKYKQSDLPFTLKLI